MNEDACSHERVLVERARQGDSSALESLLTPHEALLRARIRASVSPQLMRRLAVSDILQETRLTAFERIGEFEHRGPSSLRNWLIAIAERKARRAVQRHFGVHMRSLEREVTRGRRLPTQQFVGRQATPSEVVMSAEAGSVGRQAFEMLPDDYQQILRLCREEGLGFPAAAERMGRSYEATKKLYGRALARFTLILGRLEGEARGR